MKPPESRTLMDRIILFCLDNRLVVALLVVLLAGWGVVVAPFDWHIPGLLRNPVPVDAIPDLGENQQIVFTQWEGRSPQDMEDQITYPLSAALLGLPGVRSVRCYSMFGFSSIYIVFNEDIDFYWARSRVVEKLSSLPGNTIPQGVKPQLGPDATGLGQVFWYTLEGADPDGNPTGGWDLDELRSIQDWTVRYALMSAEGVSEVASAGGHIREYQVEVDPDAMRYYGVTLPDVFQAVKMSNQETGARSIEINRVEYLIRSRGFLKSIEDIENTVVTVRETIPVLIKNIAHVTQGPAFRRGALDKGGAEVAGGVVTVRYGENPLKVIERVKEKIREISPGLPRKQLPDGTISQIRIVPFYDRSELIHETLGTLSKALTEEILITIIVILVMIRHFRSSLLISSLLPLAVLTCFIAMKYFKVDANVVALSGIAIAVGTIVDMGIILCENILRHLEESGGKSSMKEIVFTASSEVAGAITTAVTTTVISFLPVFTMTGAEGKLFKPLAYTKTFALIASIILTVTVIPSAAMILFKRRQVGTGWKPLLALAAWCERALGRWKGWLTIGLSVLLTGIILADHWKPLGSGAGLGKNSILTALFIGIILGFFWLFQRFYQRLLRVFLRNKVKFLAMPVLMLVLGAHIWMGFNRLWQWLPSGILNLSPVTWVSGMFPGLGKEFMPPLDEGSFLFMPTTMPHASLGEVLEIVRLQDMAISRIPEVASTVGKVGRADTVLDPAPISMIETIINYHPEYLTDADGRLVKFKYDPSGEDYFRTPAGTIVNALDGEPYEVKGVFIRDEAGRLQPDDDGALFRVWRKPLSKALNPGREYWPGVKTTDDIWDAIVRAAQVPGVTSAPRLQPIAARIVMLQSGIRAPMAIQIKGHDQEKIQAFAYELESVLKDVPGVESNSVTADRLIGKPYLEIQIDRSAIARYGLYLEQVQQAIEVAIGGKPATQTVQGRERYTVSVKYMREMRNDMDAIGRLLLPAPSGQQIPLREVAEIEYVKGPQVIKSENTFLTGYVLFDKKPDWAEVAVIDSVRKVISHQMDQQTLTLPEGISYSFTGSYQNQVRAQKKLQIVLPLALLLIFMILYLQFKSVSTTLSIFSGITVAWAGGFILIWLYSQSWFLNFSLMGENIRQVFQIHPFNLSVAVWVGFLALFGIASDDGVVMASYLDQSFKRHKPGTIQEIRTAVVLAGSRRIRPCLMTTATTILALLPVLTSSGRGSGIMLPMAIPTFGGMILAIVTMFVVPVLYAAVKEHQIKTQ